MRTPIIAGNWKMNKTIAESLELVAALRKNLASKQIDSKLEIIIAPNSTAINEIVKTTKNSPIKVAAQNLFWEESGAFTGEISAPMVKSAGATHVIIGHSERRQYFHETNDTVNKKIKAALKQGLIPIVCVGETLTEREENKMTAVITTQLATGLSGLTPAELDQLVIAYEPVWAIGTGKTATPDQAEEVHLLIRKFLAEKFGNSAAKAMRILYGGSVKPSNTKELLAQPDIDGALVGGASLKAEDFIGIITNALP